MSILSTLTFDAKKITANGLRRLNLLVAALYLVETVAILILKHGASAVSVQTNFLSQDELASQSVGHTVMAEASRHLFDFKIVYLVGLGLVIVAAVHLLAATRNRKLYEAGLKNSNSSLRWKSYALTFGVMSAAAALFIGLHQLILLVVTVLAAALSLIVVDANEAGATKVARKLWQVPAGLVAGLIPAFMMGAYLASSYAYGTPPSAYSYGTLVVWLIYVYIILSVSSGAKRTRKDYLNLERSYVILGFVAMSGIAWLITAGIN